MHASHAVLFFAPIAHVYCFFVVSCSHSVSIGLKTGLFSRSVCATGGWWLSF